MKEKNKNTEHFNREEIYAERVPAGKRRTYFFDVRATRANEYYLTLTESKKRFDEEKNTFYYKKHKIFLFKEDFDKFSAGLNNVMDFVLKNNPTTKEENNPIPTAESGKEEEKDKTEISEDLTSSEKTDIKFEDLEKEK